MSGLLGDMLVGLAVLASALYAVAALGPKSWRARAYAALAAGILRLPAGLGVRALALRWAARLRAASTKAGGCGGCGDCSSGPATTPPAAAEVRVPIASISKRH